MQVIQNATVTIKQVWSYQSPVMHTWFLATSVSLAVMFVVLCLV